VRPCPFVSCRYHLYIDVDESGALKENFPNLEPWELEESCVLDVADRGGSTLEEVATALNITRERVKKVESSALAKMMEHGAMRRIQQDVEEES
jgi:hypothetical protein